MLALSEARALEYAADPGGSTGLLAWIFAAILH